MKQFLNSGLFVSFSIFIFPLTSQAGPYEDLMAKLEVCRDLETPEKRLKCFEDLVPPGDVQFSLTPALKLDPILTPTEDPEPEVKSEPIPVPKIESDKREDFGAEHIPETDEEKAQNEENKTNIFNVIRTEENRNRLVYFYMENGQVWRQLERQRIFVPRDRTFEVEITQGSFGDYKLKIEGKGRQTRVKRVK